jgi:hypothetical protein
MGTKNANGFVGEPRRLIQMYCIANMGVLFEKSKRSGEKRNNSFKGKIPHYMLET